MPPLNLPEDLPFRVLRKTWQPVINSRDLPENEIRAYRLLDEDRMMCENQVPAEVPINPARGRWGVLVTPGDTLANTFQRTFRNFLLKSREH